MAQLKYKRVLLKISGEGLSGTGQFGLDPDAIDRLTDELTNIAALGSQLAIVVGAGNFIRGATLTSKLDIHRATADHMGMLATIINCLALRDILEAKGTPCRVLSAIHTQGLCEPFVRRNAIKHLEKGRVVIFAGGTGNPFFTTDTCAALRAAEIDAELIIKATKVDGVYSADPNKDPSAKRYDKLTFDDVLRQGLGIMDHAAISLCRQNNIDIIVCDLMAPGTVVSALRGDAAGTLVTAT